MELTKLSWPYFDLARDFLRVLINFFLEIILKSPRIPFFQIRGAINPPLLIGRPYHIRLETDNKSSFPMFSNHYTEISLGHWISFSQLCFESISMEVYYG